MSRQDVNDNDSWILSSGGDVHGMLAELKDVLTAQDGQTACALQQAMRVAAMEREFRRRIMKTQQRIKIL